MTIRIKQATESRITESQIRIERPDLVFGRNDNIGEHGYPTVEEVPPPAAPSPFARVVEGPDEQYEPDKWRQTWQIVPLDPNEIIALVSDRVQQRLDAFAQTRRYDNIHTAASYAGSTIARFDVEGSYCRAKRDETWEALNTMLGEVLAGTRPMPTSYAEIEAELPPMQWPDEE